MPELQSVRKALNPREGDVRQGPIIDRQTARYLLDLEARVAALSAIVALLLRALRQGQALDLELERQIYAQASEAVATLPAELENGADRLILAMQAAAAAAQSPIRF